MTTQNTQTSGANGTPANESESAEEREARQREARMAAAEQQARAAYSEQYAAAADAIDRKAIEQFAKATRQIARADAKADFVRAVRASLDTVRQARRSRW